MKVSGYFGKHANIKIGRNISKVTDTVQFLTLNYKIY